MNFQLTTNYTYWWPVNVRIPHPDPEHAGKIIEQTLTMRFEPLDRDAQIAEDTALAALTESKEVIEHEYKLLLKVCKNWNGVVDDKKDPVAFSEDTFKKAIKQGWFRVGVYEAYSESLSGAEARLGNSETLPVDGPTPN